MKTTFEALGGTIEKFTGWEHLAHETSWLYNPSLCWWEGKLLISFRRANFEKETPRIGYGVNDLFIGELAPRTGKVSNLRLIELSSNSPRPLKELGFEDVRLFVHDGELYGIGVAVGGYSTNPTSSQALYKIDVENNVANFVKILKKPNKKNNAEKNWAYIEGSTGTMEFSYLPTKTINDDGEITGFDYEGNLHGGSKLIKYGDGWLSLVHFIDFRVGRDQLRQITRLRDYWTQLAYYGEDKYLAKLSQPFKFSAKNEEVGIENQRGIEFSSGLEYTKDKKKLLLTYGKGDVLPGLASIEVSKIDELLTIPFEFERVNLTPVMKTYRNLQRKYAAEAGNGSDIPTT